MSTKILCYFQNVGDIYENASCTCCLICSLISSGLKKKIAGDLFFDPFDYRTNISEGKFGLEVVLNELILFVQLSL